MSNASPVADLVKSADRGHGYYTDESDLGQYSSTQQAVAEKMTILVKGAGYTVTDKTHRLGALPDANQPLSDPDRVFGKAMEANRRWTKAHKQSFTDQAGVLKSFSPDFAQRFGAFAQGNPQNAMWAAWTEQIQQQLGDAIGKNVSLTAPLATGFVPFNLVAPSRLIYPV